MDGTQTFTIPDRGREGKEGIRGKGRGRYGDGKRGGRWKEGGA